MSSFIRSFSEWLRLPGTKLGHPASNTVKHSLHKTIEYCCNWFSLTFFLLVSSFSQLACLGESRTLSELTLDGNPVALETWYKQAVLRCVLHLRQLDMKRITVRPNSSPLKDQWCDADFFRPAEFFHWKTNSNYMKRQHVCIIYSPYTELL